jgi:hypothetical protein
MQHVQERLLESKMTEVEQARSWSPRVISKFETLIRNGDDLSLYRSIRLPLRATAPSARPRASTCFFMLRAAVCST